MKKILFAYLIVGPAAQAQVIECPKFYPWQDTPLTEVPYRHKGKGIVARRPLSDASAFAGEFNGASELQGVRKDVKGGYDVQLPGVTKWFVCYYGEGRDISWWEQIDDSKITRCTLRVRNKNSEGMMDATMTCK